MERTPEEEELIKQTIRELRQDCGVTTETSGYTVKCIETRGHQGDHYGYIEYPNHDTAGWSWPQVPRKPTWTGRVRSRL